jgi:hypothetical protein
VDDAVELQGLTRRYGDVVALDDLSFTVAEGQMFGFIGPQWHRQDPAVTGRRTGGKWRAGDRRPVSHNKPGLRPVPQTLALPVNAWCSSSSCQVHVVG